MLSHKADPNALFSGSPTAPKIPAWLAFALMSFRIDQYGCSVESYMESSTSSSSLARKTGEWNRI